MTLLYLILAGVFVNGMHASLLFAKKDDRRWSISEHAVISRRTYAIYVAGHILGGWFFFLFAKEFYLERYDALPMFVLACVTVLFEYLQAVIPAKGKWYMTHTIAALTMWISFIALGVWSAFSLELQQAPGLISQVLMLGVVGLLIVTAATGGKKYWLMQMSMVTLFFVSLLVMQIR